MCLDHATPEGGVPDLYTHKLPDVCAREARVVQREERCRVYNINSAPVPTVKYLCVRHECSATVRVLSEGEAVIKVPTVEGEGF